MNKITFRVDDKERISIEHAAAQHGLKNISEYIRKKILLDNESITDKIDFYQNVNLHLAELSKRNLILNQMIYQLMVKTFGENEADEIYEQIVQQVDKFVNEG